MKRPNNLLLAVVLFFLAVVFWSLRGEKQNSDIKLSSTKGLLAKAYATLYFHGENRGERVEQLKAIKLGEDEFLIVVRRWCEFPNKDLNEILSETSKKTMVDNWGNKLNAAWKSDLLSRTDAADSLKNNNCEILIWSSGPNGKNEWGNGDDVVVNIPNEYLGRKE